jgi:hypothetical protein
VLGGGLVAVKSAIFTGIQSASVTAGNNVAVTDLSITHEVADASNKLIISGFIGAGQTSENLGRLNIAVHDGTGLIGVGTTAGGRTSVAAGFASTGSEAASGNLHVTPSVFFVHTPGSGSKTYTLRAVNAASGTVTIHINRSAADGDAAGSVRAVSALVIQEVSV